MAEAAQQRNSRQLDEADMQGLWDQALHRDDGQQEPRPLGTRRLNGCNVSKVVPCSCRLSPRCIPAGCAHRCAIAFSPCAGQACSQVD